MSQYNPTLIIGCEAGAAITKYRFVEANGTGEANDRKVKEVGTVNAKAWGVCNNAPASGENAEIIVSGTAKITAAEALEPGYLLTPSANGRAEQVDAAGEFIGGMALEYASAAGEVIEIIVLHGIAHASDA